MVQVLKDSVRDQITVAAEIVFARMGYKQAAMGAIAQEAGVATGTIYKYFPNKEALFQTVVPMEFRDEFLRLTRQRISAFARPGGLDAGQAVLRGESGELLHFWMHNRLKVIILLARSEGSCHETFAADYLKDMADQTLAQARSHLPELEVSDLFRFMVNKILSDSIRGIVMILERFQDQDSVARALAASATYQLAGINAFIQWHGKEHAVRTPDPSA